MVKFQLRHGNDLLAMDCIRNCDVSISTILQAPSYRGGDPRRGFPQIYVLSLTPSPFVQFSACLYCTERLQIKLKHHIHGRSF